MSETDEHLAEPHPAAPAERQKRSHTFLGRLGQAVREQNWFAVVLELAIVVAGVLIALAANDWAASRQARTVEAGSLRELRAALTNDLRDIRANQLYHAGAEASARLLREHVRLRGPYSDTLDAHFGLLLAASTSIRDEAAYETMKQRGMDIVTDDSLRISIGHLYGVTYPSVSYYQDFAGRFVEQHQIPFYNANFEDARFGVTATPVNYSALLGSTEFVSILDWLVVNNSVLAGMLEGAEAEVVDLIHRLDEALGDEEQKGARG